jgi:hypothetical protein
MRQTLLGQPTQRQSQVALSATTADIDNDQTDEQVMEKEKNTTTTTTTTTANKNIYDKDDKLFVHYTHENRFQSLKRDMHQAHKNIFGNTPAIYSKLIVGNRNRRNAQHELIRKRPKKTLLQNTFTQSMYHINLSQSINTNLIKSISFLCVFFNRTTKEKEQKINSNTSNCSNIVEPISTTRTKLTMNILIGLEHNKLIPELHFCLLYSSLTVKIV